MLAGPYDTDYIKCWEEINFLQVKFHNETQKLYTWRIKVNEEMEGRKLTK